MPLHLKLIKFQIKSSSSKDPEKTDQLPRNIPRINSPVSRMIPSIRAFNSSHPYITSTTLLAIIMNQLRSSLHTIARKTLSTITQQIETWPRSHHKISTIRDLYRRFWSQKSIIADFCINYSQRSSNQVRMGFFKIAETKSMPLQTTILASLSIKSKI